MSEVSSFSPRMPVRTVNANIGQAENFIADQVDEAEPHANEDYASSSSSSLEDIEAMNSDSDSDSDSDTDTDSDDAADEVATDSTYDVLRELAMSTQHMFVDGRRRPLSTSSTHDRAHLSLQRQVASLTDTIRYQRILIDGLKAKQSLMEEKEARLVIKAKLLGARLEEQQKEILELRSQLLKEREEQEEREERRKEEQDRKRLPSDQKEDRKSSYDSKPQKASQGALSRSADAQELLEKKRSSGGSDTSPDKRERGSSKNPMSPSTMRGKQRAKERLKSLIGSSVEQKQEKMATLRQNFEMKDEMLKRVVERLNSEPVGLSSQLNKSKSHSTSSDSSDVARERSSQIINEFITTEETYVNNLRLIIEAYMTPLREAILNGHGILSSEEIEVLFSRDITMMYTLHSTLLSELKTTSAFTSALNSFVPYLKIYTQYVNNFPQAMDMLTQKMSKSKRFHEFVKEQQGINFSTGSYLGKTNETLSSLLVMPIQRLPRYELLLKDIIGCTPADSTQATELKKLFTSVVEVNNHVNESKRKLENTQKLSLIQKNLIGNHSISLFDRIGRKYLMEGRMGARLVHGKGGTTFSKWRKVKGHDKQPPAFSRHLFILFDDLLIETKQTKDNQYTYKRSYNLDDISIDDYEGTEEGAEKIFVITDEEDGRVLHVKADSVSEKLEWMQTIAKHIDLRFLDEAAEQRPLSIGSLEPVAL